jgi:UDP-N-acetylglucosamine diphosphorylase/glucosamine-1-phosphate N-acetyltransferase
MDSMNIVLFDTFQSHARLKPFSFTRPCADIRIGILTIREKWERHLGQSCSCLTLDYLSVKYPLDIQGDDVLYIDGCLLPSPALVQAIRALTPGQALHDTSGHWLAFRTVNLPVEAILTQSIEGLAAILYDAEAVQVLKRPWDIFSMNDWAIRQDYTLLTAGRTSAPISASNQVMGTEIFLEPGAVVECSILNANTGPIYIAADAEIMEGSIVRGPLALCEHASLKLGTKIYGATTVGPHCKAGGELNNVVMFAYSNKGHDGFIGNAVLGEWCNLGADTNCSNLKNNYSSVRVWDYETQRNIDTGLQFCGLLMGDHSKCGINTMFNTGTVVGVSANIYGGNFPDKHIKSFAWGGSEGFEQYDFEKACETAQRVMQRRKMELSQEDKNILKAIMNSDS